MILRCDTVAAMRDRDVSISLWEGFGVQPNADARGIKTTIEIGTGSLPDLPAALAVVGHVGRLSFRLLIDTLHFFRIGGTVADIAALDSNIIGYVQLCDAPLVSKYASVSFIKKIYNGLLQLWGTRSETAAKWRHSESNHKRPAYCMDNYAAVGCAGVCGQHGWRVSRDVERCCRHESARTDECAHFAVRGRH